MKGDQSNWSKLSRLEKKKEKNKIQWCEGKGIIRNFVLLVRTQSGFG
jgi:hypothetical protein